MEPIQPLKKLIYRLWLHISLQRRIQFGLLLFLMILASFSEIVSIGAVLPFLGVLTSPDQVFEHPAAQPIIQWLGLISAEQLLLPLTIIFSLAALIAGAMRLLLLWSSTRLSHITGSDLSINIYRKTLYQPYSIHVSRNSSEIINGISSKTGAVTGVILLILTLISSSVMLVAILFALLSIEPIIALITFSGFGLIYGLIIWVTKKRQLINSKRIANNSTQVIKYIQEGLGGIRDVLINGSQPVYCKIYKSVDLSMRRAQGNSVFISSFPRYGMEALGMTLIASIAYVLAQESDGITKAIPILGALALGAQRLLPVLQQAYSSWSSIQANHHSLHDTLELLDQPLPDFVNQSNLPPISFNKHIKINQLSFRYTVDTPFILNNINLEIRKGSRVGFIGKTGSGKSTLLDIVMGLLQPTKGAIEIDGHVVTSTNQRAWQAHIAHVPQYIFLSDCSIEENIAFGIPKNEIDHNRVKKAARDAQISDTIEGLTNKYLSFVGEHGVRLSGGQRQRLGIARALYKEADVIIFDEATSALDNEVEESVMETINSLSDDITILVIAHRLTTLKNCSVIVELSNCAIKRIGSYQEIINK